MQLLVRWFLPFDRCCAVLPAAALQPCTLPGALPHAAAVDALHYMLCNPPVHPLSSCSSPKDRLCTASVLSFILTLFFPLRSHFSARNHPDEPHLDSKATGVIPCLRQRMGSRAFIVQGCPCVPCRCRRSFTNNTNKSTVSQIIYSVPQMRFTWLAKPSRFHMVCETMKRFTWFVKLCEIRTIKPVKFFRVLTKPCEITDPYGSLRSDGDRC